MENIARLVGDRVMFRSSAEKKAVVVANPTDEFFINYMGYKSYVEDEIPEHDVETQYVELVGEEKDGVIYGHWVVKDIEEMSEEE